MEPGGAGEGGAGARGRGSLRGRAALVTGGAAGIGAAVARRLAAEGAAVALLDRDGAKAEKRAAELRAGGARALAHAGDVTEASACREAVERVCAELGPVEVLVANAGTTHLGRFAETRLEVIHRVVEVNLFGAVNVAKAALPSLLERRGRIAVLSSVAGFAPLASRSGYAASKHALHGFFESLRAEHAREGLSVTLVCPSFVDTELGSRALGPDGAPAAPGARTGFRDPIAPEVVAAALVRGLERRRRLVLPPGSRLPWWVSRIAPALYERLMVRRLSAG